MLISVQSLLTHFTRNIIMGFHYAVAKGRKPGIYSTWDECKKQVYKFSGPVYKKFSVLQEAQAFIDSHRKSPTYGNSKLENFLHARSTTLQDSATKKVPVGREKDFDCKKRTRESDEPKKQIAITPRKKLKTTKGDEASLENSLNLHKNDFHTDPDGFVNVYTDGACSKNGQTGAKAGVGVYFGNDSPLNISAPVVGRATNNMAEIQAVTRAAEVAQKVGITKLRIHTDSSFLIQCITQWMPKWKRQGWKTSTGTPVLNKNELLAMELALKPLTVKWNHVRGHQGIYGNEMADQFAREGAKKYLKQ